GSRVPGAGKRSCALKAGSGAGPGRHAAAITLGSSSCGRPAVCAGGVHEGGGQGIGRPGGAARRDGIVEMAVAHATDVEAPVQVSATLTLEEAARRSWHALVVGAGPAGATAARELARRGLDVLLVDRAAFPRWKVCGCCLNGNALATLAHV